MQNENLIEEYNSEFISYLLDEGYASDVKSAEAIYKSMSDEWFYGVLDELNRYAKETDTSFKSGRKVVKGGTFGGNDTTSRALRDVTKMHSGGLVGTSGRGKKKKRGEKPRPGSEGPTPAQKVADRRRRERDSEEMQRSRFD